MRRWLVTWAICAAAILTASRASQADLLLLESTGAFGPSTTLGGTALGEDTNYSFRAVFDSAKDRNPIVGEKGAGYFGALEFAITIEGHGTFEGVPSNDLNVVLLDPTYHLGIHAVGLLSADGQRFFLDSYASVVPTFDARSPSPTAFVDYLETVTGFPYEIPLAGAATKLVINDAGKATRTATVVAIPEPPTLVLLLVGIGAWGRIRAGWQVRCAGNSQCATEAEPR